MRILVTGATGFIGGHLVERLAAEGHQVRCLVRASSRTAGLEAVGAEVVRGDVTEASSVAASAAGCEAAFHLAALLSATAESRPRDAWDINMNGLMHVLEVARAEECSVFTPSSIGAFGPTTPKDHTPQDTLQRPTTMYGVTKVAGELLCDYYHHRYGVDTRGVRFPGIISNVTPPGGGTTDYAVDMYYEAVRKKRYTCFIQGDTYLDMMYMPDALKAAMDIMEADPARLRHRNAFNVTAMSFCPEEEAAHIRKHIPGFEIDYNVDPVRQAIANSWPNCLEDYAARVEWGWQPEYDLEKMTLDMLASLAGRPGKTETE